MAKPKPEIIVVGAGLIGQKHIEVAAGHGMLAAIVDPNEDARAIADRHETSWFSDLERCLAAKSPDGAILATPNHLHEPGGIACLEAGVPVLIEKPLAEGVGASRNLVAAQKRTATPILVGHHRRHSPIVQHAKSLLEQGKLGRIVAVNGMFWLHKPVDYFKATWRTKAGAGPTFINLIHDIDLLQYFCGPITRVQALEANHVRGFEVEDTSAVILEFASGALGTISISDTISAPWSWELTAGENPAYPKTDQSCYTIGGTEGSLSVPDLSMWSHTGEQSWWSPIEQTEAKIANADPIQSQFAHFLDVIAGTPPRVSAEDGLRNICVLEAIKLAAKTQKIQDVEA